MLEKVILTGFEAFGPYKYNPVCDTTLRFNRQNLDALEIFGLVLPPNYYEASEILLEKIKEISPSMVLSMGLASSVSRIRFEAVGNNRMESKYADNQGRKPDGEKIIADGEMSYRTNVDNVALALNLDEVGIPAEVSINADYFVCNSLIYLTARNIEKENLQIKFGFFHTPWTDAYINLVDIAPEKTIIKQEYLEKAIRTTLVGMKKCLTFTDKSFNIPSKQ